ncbi:hypothetical protein HanLR1_Chr00c2799g0857701 [Helianthus annuus]|nr:hypothetical protein HanLR1_Chr00c2799g0857701 [Helianthus annuus]
MHVLALALSWPWHAFPAHACPWHAIPAHALACHPSNGAWGDRRLACIGFKPRVSYASI